MKTIHDPRSRELIDVLIKLREAAPVTQTELVARLNKPQSYVAKVENLDRRLDMVELADWAMAIGVDGGTLLKRLSWWI